MRLQSHIRAKGKGKEALGFMTRVVDSKLTLREWLPLIGITVSAFIFNTSEFMPVGLLTGIGASFGTSEGVTGLIISVYAWAVMLLSLPLMILGSRLAFRPPGRRFRPWRPAMVCSWQRVWWSPAPIRCSGPLQLPWR